MRSRASGFRGLGVSGCWGLLGIFLHFYALYDPKEVLKLFFIIGLPGLQYRIPLQGRGFRVKDVV